MTEIKIELKKKQASEKILELIKIKLNLQNTSCIGIRSDGSIDYGFSAYNDEPDVIIFKENDDLSNLDPAGLLPRDINEWTINQINEMVDHIETLLISSDFSLNFINN